MRLYWIEMAQEHQSVWPLGHGVGVTAYSEEEAIRLVKEAFSEFGLKDVNVFDVATIKQLQNLDGLDPGHVRPNMGNHLKRGVWFPLLKSDSWN